jgi:hypothetical protein
VVTASSDTTAASGVFVVVGGQLFKVSLQGAVATVGPMTDSVNTYSPIVPSALVLAGGSIQCLTGTVLCLRAEKSKHPQAPCAP